MINDKSQIDCFEFNDEFALFIINGQNKIINYTKEEIFAFAGLETVYGAPIYIKGGDDFDGYEDIDEPVFSDVKKSTIIDFIFNNQNRWEDEEQ